MSSEVRVGRIESDDGKCHVDILARDDGLFRFVEHTQITDQWEDTFWTPTHWSGLYSDRASAEREAHRILHWLRNRPSFPEQQANETEVSSDTSSDMDPGRTQ